MPDLAAPRAGWTKTPNDWLEEVQGAGAALPGCHRAVVLTLLRETIGFHERALVATHGYLAEQTGYAVRSVGRALADLERWRVIRREGSGHGRSASISLLEVADWNVTETAAVLERRQRRRRRRSADQLDLPLPGVAEVVEVDRARRMAGIARSATRSATHAACGRSSTPAHTPSERKKKKPRGPSRRGTVRPRSLSRSEEEGAMPNGPTIFGGRADGKPRSTDYEAPTSDRFTDEDRARARRRRAAREVLRERGYAGSFAEREAEIDRIAVELTDEEVESRSAASDERTAGERRRRIATATRANEAHE